MVGVVVAAAHREENQDEVEKEEAGRHTCVAGGGCVCEQIGDTSV